MPGTSFPSINSLNITEFGVFKLLDKIDVSRLLDQIVSQVGSSRTLTDLQHGFRTGRSCETQLITTFHDIASAYNKKGSQIDIAIWTFPKHLTQSHMTAYSVNSSTTTLKIKLGHEFLIF